MTRSLAVHTRGPTGADSDLETPTIVLVHGVGGSATTSFTALVPALARRHRVIAVDLPGSGGSLGLPAPTGGWTLDHLADALAGSVRDQITREEPGLILLGHSMGGAVAARAAVRHPGLSDLLLLAAVPLVRDPRLRLWSGMWRRLHGIDRDLMARHMILGTASPSWLAGLRDQDIDDLAALAVELTPPGLDLQLDLASAEHAVQDDLDRFPGRVLALLGDEDPLVRVEPWLARAAARAELEVRMRPAGHDVLAHHHREAVAWLEEHHRERVAAHRPH